MESKEKTYLIRWFEKCCKSVYKLKGFESIDDYREQAKYSLIKDICIGLHVLTEEQIEEHENHMKEQYK